MIALLKAIQTAWNNNTAFSSFTHGLETAAAADSESVPNCILNQVSVVNDYNTRTSLGVSFTETASLQFTVRSTDGDQVSQALEDIQGTFDHKGLTFTSTTDVLMDARLISKNTVTKEDERMYRGDAEYQFKVSRVLSNS